jgi:hypothetical protein
MAFEHVLDAQRVTAQRITPLLTGQNEAVPPAPR